MMMLDENKEDLEYAGRYSHKDVPMSLSHYDDGNNLLESSNNNNMNDLMDDSSYSLNKNDAWHVITAYFAEKGLVRQQLDSFDEFIQNTMQEVVEESLPIDIYPDAHHPLAEYPQSRERHRFKFGQLHLSAPQLTESDGKVDTMLPNLARIRNLT